MEDQPLTKNFIPSERTPLVSHHGQSTWRKDDYRGLSSDDLNRRKTIEQVKVYLVTYIAYALIHFEREFWSLSKAYLKHGQYKNVYTTTILSRFDFAELVTYSIFLYLSGIIGDSFDQRKVLTLAYIGLAISFFLLGVPGFFDMTQDFFYYYFIVIMVIIGALNALLWPCFISILGHWFPKKSQGITIT